MPPRVKVLQVINTLSAGGAEVFVADLSIALKRLCEVRIWTFGGVRDQKGQNLSASLQQAGIDVTSAGISNKLGMISVPGRLARYVDHYRPDIVHAHLDQSELVSALSMYLCRRRPVLIRTSHNVRIEWPLARKMRPWLASRYDWSVACSNAVLNAGYALPKDRACAIDNGIALPELGARAVLRRQVRAELNVRSGMRVLLQIGAMRGAPMPKAHDVVIEAFAQGGFARSSELVFVGDGPKRADLEARARELGIESSIHFCGVVSEPVKYILAADLVLMPSLYEGLPLVAAEAACAGAPMVVSDIEPLREFVSKATAVCRPGEVSSLIGSIQYGLDHCEEMWQEGEKLVPMFQERFDIRRVANRYFDLYECLLNNRDEFRDAERLKTGCRLERDCVYERSKTHDYTFERHC
jgi:glycosyltransferase involved in cell wall biosynthesis